MPLAATWYDLVLGTCIHVEMLPPPVSSPCPFPNVYVGLVFDPLGAILEAAVGAVLGSGSGPVSINGVTAANTGTSTTNLPLFPVTHIIPIPPGISWTAPTVPLPSGSGDLLMGSKTVSIKGSAAVRIGDIALTDGDPVQLPTGAVLAIPKGSPVLIGGPPTIDGMVAAGAALSLLGELASGLRALQRSSRRWARLSASLHRGLESGFGGLRRAFPRLSQRGSDALHAGLCFLTGHPVDVVTGRLLTSVVDFELPGPIPLRFERHYASSRSWRDGVLGPGWSHSLDQAVWLELDRVVYRTEDGREVEYESHDRPHGVIAPGDECFDASESCTLRCTEPFVFEVETKDGIVREFRRLDPRSEAPPDRRVSKLVRIRSLDGHEIRLSYDTKTLLLTTVHDSAGRRVLFEHDERGKLARVLLPHPDLEGAHLEHCRYEHCAEGDLVAVRDAAGHPFRYSYEAHLLVRETDRNGLSFYFGYDGIAGSARCVRTWGDGGMYDHRLLYDPANRSTLVNDSYGAPARYVYDERNLVTKIIDAHDAEELFAYDAHLRKTTHTDRAGRTTRWEYDARSNPTKITLPDGAAIEVTYGPEDRPAVVVDPRGNRWTYEHDGFGRMVSATSPGGDTTRWEWLRGLVRAVVAPGGGRTELEYDAHKNLALLRTPEGAEHRSRHDLLGRVVERSNPRDPRAQRERREHDRLGRCTVLVGMDGVRAEHVFDDEGNLLREIFPSREIIYGYAGYYQLAFREERPRGQTPAVDVHDQLPARVSMEYDLEDRLVAVVNEAGERYQFVHDRRGDVVHERGFDGGLTQYFREPKSGDVTEVWQPSSSRRVLAEHGRWTEQPRTGRRTRYERDACGRVCRVVHSDGSSAGYEHDASGAIVRAENEAGVVVFERDAAGRIVREGFVRSGAQEIAWVESSYDPTGERAALATSLGHQERIARNASGDVSNVATRSGWAACFQRDAVGLELERRYTGGIAVRWQRDVLGRPIERRTDTAAAVLSTWRFEWSPEGLLSAFGDPQDPWRGTVAHYDYRQRLVATSPGADPRRVSWRNPDATGNLYRALDRNDRRYGRGGRLERSDGSVYERDADGFLLSKTTADGRTWRYAWDGFGQLRTVTRPDGSTVSFAYDALGRRVGKTIADPPNPAPALPADPFEALDYRVGTKRLPEPPPPLVVREVRWIWDGHVPVHEIASDAPPTTWTWEPDTFALLAKHQAGKTYGAVPDQLGTPAALYDEAGALAWRAQLDLYGVAWADVETTKCPWRWPGQYEDEETGLYYNRFRYYDPEAGRYISRDPIGLAGGLSVFGYPTDPLGRLDPFGLAVSATTRQLVANLQAAHRPVIGPQTAHHIVERRGGGSFGGHSRTLLARHHVDIDAAVNGARLWGTHPAQVAHPLHPGRGVPGYHAGRHLHGAAASEQIYRVLRAAERRGMDVGSILADISARMETGRWRICR